MSLMNLTNGYVLRLFLRLCYTEIMHFVQAKGILSAKNGMNLYRGWHNTRLMNIFRARCKENGIETNPDVIFAYLSAFDKIPGKTNAQLELF